MIEQTSQGLIIKVKVIPKSTTTSIVGWEGDELKIRVAAAPDKGKANQLLIKFLAKFFDLTQAEVILLSGETNRHKRILLAQADYHQVSSKILSALTGK